jgi:glycosyltransferase involved in cell wall biosynthesis
MRKNMEEPLISINLTSFNRAHLIPRCLDAVLKQSYSNFEVNIVDDCSTDDTRLVVQKYQDLDTRIKYFKHEYNKGNAFSRNTALLNSKGKFVAFMDDDDEWVDTHKLKKQIQILEGDKEGEIGLVCSSLRIINEEGSYDKIITEPKSVVKKILIGNSFIYNSTVVARKSVMNEIGGFDEKLPRGIDSDFFRTLIVIKKYKVYFLPDITTNVHEYGDDRITSLKTITSMKKDITSNEYCLNKYKEVFKNHKEIKRERKIKLFKKYLRLLYKDPSFENLLRMFKGMSL